MIIIGEKINGSIPVVADAIARRDADFIKARAVAQEKAGATFIDCCASVPEDQEVETLADPEYFMQMDGQAVFKFAVRSVPQAVEEVLEANRVKKEEISCYILHQANRRIVEAVAKRLGEPLEKFPMNLQEYGNTSSASIPILLDEQNRSGKLKKGDRIVLAGFGAGLSWGASILDWE